MKSYRYADGTFEAVYEIKRSKFIATVMGEVDGDSAETFVKNIKKKYADATHNCYAYIGDVNGQATRFSDDGEPGGTAGQPILEVLRKKGLVRTAVVVTRYFGGIKLGAGGLVRAYSHTARLALDAAHIITYEQYTELELVCSYSDYQKYQAEFPRFGAVIDDTQFSDRVTLLFSVKDPIVEDVFARVREISNGGTQPTVRGKRFDYR